MACCRELERRPQLVSGEPSIDGTKGKQQRETGVIPCSVFSRACEPIDLFRCFFQRTTTQGADMAARMDGSSPTTVDFSTPLAPPGMSCQRPRFVRQRVVNGNAEEPVTVDLPHLSSKVRTMIRPAFQNVVLPLMDHLVGQCVEDDLFVGQTLRRQSPDQGKRQSNAAPMKALSRLFGHVGSRSHATREEAQRGGQPSAPLDEDRWQPSIKILPIEPIPKSYAHRGVELG